VLLELEVQKSHKHLVRVAVLFDVFENFVSRMFVCVSGTSVFVPDVSAVMAFKHLPAVDNARYDIAAFTLAATGPVPLFFRKRRQMILYLFPGFAFDVFLRAIHPRFNSEIP
jgi:hypothetical protein